jgi:2-aminoadipate transaminase
MGSCAMKGTTSPRSFHWTEYRRPNGGHYSGNVIYLSTFSKLLAPGLRLAWVVAPPEVIRRLVMTKQAADLHTSSFNQYVAYEVAKGGFLDEHVKVIRATYKERRDVMFEMMEEMFPAGVTLEQTAGRHVPVGRAPRAWTRPRCSNAPSKGRSRSCPGAAFHPNGGGKNTMRINFSYSAPDTIREGITRLGTTLKELISEKA